MHPLGKKTITSYQNHLPRRVCFGRGQLDHIVDRCKELDRSRVFVVSDSGVEAAGLLDITLDRLAESGLLRGSFAQIAPEPPIEQVDQLASLIKESQSDLVIAIGGGSVMDATKVAGVLAKHSGSARDYVGIGKVPSRGIASILIPTTSGTGSEATFVAILTDKSTGNKAGVVSPHLLADVAIVDPSLTDRLPVQITAATGMDAMVHALEALIAKCSTPLARGLALQSAGNIGWALEAVVQDPSNLPARDAMSLGSHLAGMSFANSSCCGVHALALPLGGRYPIPHGVITGTFFSEVMRFNASACAEEFGDFSVALGWGNLSTAQFCNRIETLAQSIGLFDQLHRFTIDADSIQDMAKDACANRRLMDPNPVAISEQAAQAIYRKLLKV